MYMIHGHNKHTYIHACMHRLHTIMLLCEFTESLKQGALTWLLTAGELTLVDL